LLLFFFLQCSLFVSNNLTSETPISFHVTHSHFAYPCLLAKLVSLFLISGFIHKHARSDVRFHLILWCLYIVPQLFCEYKFWLLTLPKNFKNENGSKLVLYLYQNL
jgi:hypothetical protein